MGGGDGGGTLMYFRQTNGLLAIFLATEKLVGAQMVVIGIGNHLKNALDSGLANCPVMVLPLKGSEEMGKSWPSDDSQKITARILDNLNRTNLSKLPKNGSPPVPPQKKHPISNKLSMSPCPPSRIE